jgi:hypothetical protein
MDDRILITMSDAALMDAWRNVSDRIAREDEARARGQGYWCGTPYLSDVAWQQQIAEELRRRGLRLPV